MTAQLAKKVKSGRRSFTTPVVIGDRIRVKVDHRGVSTVETVLERRNELFRLAPGRRTLKDILAANLDNLIVVQALHRPEFHGPRLDRFLAIAEQADISATVVLNKEDLATPAEAEEVATVYRCAGYPVIISSAKTGDHIEEIAGRLRGISAFVGPSGVGKSTILNRIRPDLHLRTEEVSEVTGEGRHTTVASELLDLGHGNYVADTPGLRDITLTDIDRYEVAWLFREFQPFVGQCRFPDCLHRDEPGCIIRVEVEAERIGEMRYRSYLRLLEDVTAGFLNDWEM